jgi:D-alanyl-D-alanine dipeptidase
MKLLAALAMALTLLSAASRPQIPSETRQLIVVVTKDWQSPQAMLQRYEKGKKGWMKVGKPFAVIVGKHGLGWGRGLHHIPKNATPVKKEGDGKAPAGIFRLKNAFGYQPFKIRYPYKVYKETNHCVDDSSSRYYNRIVDSTKVTRDYKSFERMKFPKNYYKYGLVVDHNPKAIRGAGSCIFVHIKKPNKIPTVGCTAMSETEIKELLKWLDPQKHPLLIQAPRSEITALLPFKSGSR